MWYVLILVGALVGMAAGWFLGVKIIEKKYTTEEGTLEQRIKARLKEAEQEAESIRQKAELERNEIILQAKKDMEDEARKSEASIKEREKRLARKEERLEKEQSILNSKRQELERREKELQKRETDLERKQQEAETELQRIEEELQKIAGLSREEALAMLEQRIVDEARQAAYKEIKKIEESARKEMDQRAKEILVSAIQRYASDYVANRTVSVVELPNEEMKGRIIGREGRNIRALEAATGVDVIIDDTPEAVVLSSFNPVRREIAKMALTRLVSDGRIHPTRIEEVVASCEKEFQNESRKLGEQVAMDMGLQRLHPELLYLLGTLKYRSATGQNLLQHSVETAYIAGLLASELGISIKLARRAGLLHDIGKALDHKAEGSHSKVGADVAAKYGENNQIVHAIAAHHGEVEPSSILDHIVQIANVLSAQRPGARPEMFATYIKRLDDLEKLATSLDGVKKAYAIQAGREIRVLVENNKLDDAAAHILAKELAATIENHLAYPGEIKVSVIRETRAVDYAR